MVMPHGYIMYVKELFLHFVTLPHTTCSWNHHHHHHVVPLARIYLTLSRHFSLSFIASGRSSELHPISSHSCCMYVRADRPAFARPYVEVQSLMSSSLLLQQCPACLVHLTWIVFMMGGALWGVAARTWFGNKSKRKTLNSNLLYSKMNLCHIVPVAERLGKYKWNEIHWRMFLGY